ncbi:MAG TPA: DUF378 domain-containing protein [Acidimicrobiales bacterium]|nr:DUF378 domain-containing protein [Acidimicrobiales bacterium]
MFRRKPASLKDKMLARGGGLADATASSVKRFSDRGPGKLDGYAAGVLGLGIVNWVSMSLFNFDLVKAVAGRKSVSGRTAYGLLSLSALYGAVRGAQKASR